MAIGGTLLFIAFFQVSKHNPLLATINPFGNDPYDAVGSLATLVTLIAAGMSLFQAFRLRIAAKPVDREKKLVLARLQMTSILAVGVTVYCDSVGMVQHFSLWRGTSGGALLALYLAFLALMCALAALLVVHTGQIMPEQAWRTWLTIAGLVALAAVALVGYPDNVRDGSTLGALGAIADGDIALLVLIRVLVMALIPFGRSSEKRIYWWPQVIVFGLITGFLFSLIERFAENGQLLIATVLFTLAWCFGICLSYALLARPLGLYSLTLRTP